MRTLVGIVPACAGAVLLVISPVVGLAHTMRAPSAIHAQSDGSFEYRFVFTAGTATEVAGSGWDAVENVSSGIHGDCFCSGFCQMDAGDSIVWVVTGSLLDPEQEGSVRNWVALCAEPGAESVTQILPAVASVGDPSSSQLRLWNAPNPFTDHTTFHYTLPSSARVELSVHDAVGRAMATPLRKDQSAGAHAFNWRVGESEAARWPRGVYFARLRIDGKTAATRVMIRR